MKGKIFIIEDEASIVQLVQHNLEKEGFVVSSSLNGNEGLKELKKFEPNLLLLDWMLPDLSGIDICKNIRRDSNFKSLPIIMLTAKGEEEDKIKGLESGVDDYITKPFDLEELHVRIKALLRRTNRAQLNSSNQQEILNYGPLTLVPERFEAIWFESPVRLTHLEFELLHCLLQRHGQTVSPALILKEVWGYEPDDDIETIRVHIRHLRTKLEPDPRKPIYIKTVYGAGYCLELPIGSQVETARQEFIQARNPDLINSALD